jgi:hypothetical protein
MVWLWRHALYPSLISLWADTAINNHTHGRRNFQQRTSTFTLLYKIQYSYFKTAAGKLVTMTLCSTFQFWLVKKDNWPFHVTCLQEQYINLSLWLEVLIGIKGKSKAHPTTGHESREGSGGITPLFHLAVMLEWGSKPHPGRLDPGKRPDTHCRGDWVGPRAGLDAWEISRSHRNSLPGPFKP